MIYILQIGLAYGWGGIESCVMNYYKYIDRNRLQFDFVDIYGKGFSFSEEIKQFGGEIYILPDCRRHPFSAAYRLCQILKSEKYDIVHINMLSAANIIPALVASLFRRKLSIIVHSHNTDVPSGMLRKLLNRINRRSLQKMPVEKWACSIPAGRWMWGEEFDDKNVIHNAIDINRFRFDSNARNTIRRKCGFQEEDIVIGFVGRLAEQKNVLFLGEIMEALRGLSPKYKLIIVGDGVLGRKLKVELKQKHLEDAVYFAGAQKDVAPWYSAMDAFVLPSFFEGLGVVGLEAQACNLYCFVSNNVPKELNITNKVIYLPIDQNGEIWGETIHTTLQKNTIKTSVFPVEYEIAFATACLEKRYRAIIKKKITNEVYAGET